MKKILILLLFCACKVQNESSDFYELSMNLYEQQRQRGCVSYADYENYTEKSRQYGDFLRIDTFRICNNQK